VQASGCNPVCSVTDVLTFASSAARQCFGFWCRLKQTEISEILFSSYRVAPGIFGHFRSSPFSFVTHQKCLRSNTAEQVALHVAKVCEWPFILGFLQSFIFVKHVFFFITFLYLSVFYLQFPLLMATKCRSVSAAWDETVRLQNSGIAWDESLLLFGSQERGESQCKVTTVIWETFVRRCMRKSN
jgi:hypothetical protein